MEPLLEIKPAREFLVTGKDVADKIRLCFDVIVQGGKRWRPVKRYDLQPMTGWVNLVLVEMVPADDES
jgi:hypothetical protein